MAEKSYEVDAYGAEVKVRSVGAVVGLHAVTLGFYNLYWYYKINRELRDFGRVYRLDRLQGINPWLSLLAVTLGAFLIVPAIVSWWRCTGRIHEAQKLMSRDPISGWALGLSFVGGLLFTPVLLIIPWLVQDELNELWEPFRGVDPLAAHDPRFAQVSLGALDALPRARAWDTSRVDEDLMREITSFLHRRPILGHTARERLGRDIASKVRPLVAGPEPGLEDERLLELVAAARTLGPEPGRAA